LICKLCFVAFTELVAKWKLICTVEIGAKSSDNISCSLNFQSSFSVSAAPLCCSRLAPVAELSWLGCEATEGGLTVDTAGERGAGGGEGQLVSSVETNVFNRSRYWL